MSQFKNVCVEKKANVYFDGKVTSRALTTEEGNRITLGIMLPGEYEFGTSEKELMEVLAGAVDVLLPGEADWRSLVAGDSFEVPANAKFQLKVHTLMDYICSYFS